MITMTSVLAALSLRGLFASFPHAQASSAVVPRAEEVSSPFPPTPEGLTVIQSLVHPNVSISYKEPGICETTPDVKSYSGYVHLPPYVSTDLDESQDYPLNTFFWFFESRNDPSNAPLVIVLNGGPGGASTSMATSNLGPCLVEPASNSTRLNPWSWNNNANLLFIDQPNFVGFSYDVLTNVTVRKSLIQPADFASGIPAQTNSFRIGVTGSQEILRTANSTDHAAMAIWHFAQTWFSEQVNVLQSPAAGANELPDSHNTNQTTRRFQ